MRITPLSDARVKFFPSRPLTTGIALNTQLTPEGGAKPGADRAPLVKLNDGLLGAQRARSFLRPARNHGLGAGSAIERPRDDHHRSQSEGALIVCASSVEDNATGDGSIGATRSGSIPLSPFFLPAEDAPISSRRSADGGPGSETRRTL